MSAFLNDILYAFRQLRKSPGFTAVAVLTLALGIGANLALFGILNEMFLRPKPVARPHELWAIQSADMSGQPVGANLCRPYYEAVRREGHMFEGVVGYADINPKRRLKDGVERTSVQLVSGDYFSFLGLTPVLGRSFLPEEDTESGRRAVAVISHAFWQGQFGGTADVLGKTVTLNDTVVEIVGVAPKGFTGLGFWPPNLWMPASMEPVLGQFTSYTFVGRLLEPRRAKAVADLLTPVVAEVTKELSTFSDPRWGQYGVSPDFHRVRLDPIGRGLLGTFYLRPRIVSFLRFAGVATVLLLLTACANVASLFLARALQRRKEAATRVALGATRRALVRLVLCEGVLLAAGGTAGSLLAFSWIGRVVMKFAAWWPGPPLRLVPDVRVLLFAVGGTLAVGVGFSLLPALQATGFSAFAVLKDGGGAGRKRMWLRHGLVVAQSVGSLVLLCGATLCLRSMSRQLAVDLGYPHDRVATATLDLERIGLTESTFEPQLAEIVRRVSLVPGIEQIAVAAMQPLSGRMAYLDATEHLEGYGPDAEPVNVGLYNGVGPGTFSALGVPLLRGREFTPQDIESGRKTVIVNESFVRRLWPGQDPLGMHIRQWEVIGVVKDARLDRHDEPPMPAIFRVTAKKALLHPTLLIRTAGDSRHAIAPVRTELARIHPMLAQGEIRTLRDTIKEALSVQHAAMRILSALGGLALVLASVGTYGVMAYVVNSRTREIGIRLAVGATRGGVMRLILSAGLRLGLIAVAIGVPLALSAAAIFRHQIADISPFDPVTAAVAALCILVASVAACYVPARRAAKVDPMEALRYE